MRSNICRRLQLLQEFNCDAINIIIHKLKIFYIIWFACGVYNS